MSLGKDSLHIFCNMILYLKVYRETHIQCDRVQISNNTVKLTMYSGGNQTEQKPANIKTYK